MSDVSISGVIAGAFADELGTHAGKTACDVAAPEQLAQSEATDGAPNTAVVDQTADANAPELTPASMTKKRVGSSKSDAVLKKLRLARGVTVAQIMEATGWQGHSVRGFLSAVVRKKLGLTLTSEIGKDGQRRYRVIDAGQ